jgi:parvulin-like peptidyl-prolyl isomerase
MTQDGTYLAPQPPRRRKLRIGMIFGTVCLLAACVAIRYYWGAESASADAPTDRARSQAAAASRPAAPAEASSAKQPTARNIVAAVNGETITRDELARECLRHYGDDVLERVVNKYLITQECKRRGIEVTEAEVDAEITRISERFSLPVDQWLKMLKKERGITPQQYAEDIVWPTLALRKLAGEQLKVEHEELVRAYETQYGPAVRARLIACKELEKAKRAHAAAVAEPEEFGDIAKQYSEDVNSASLKGLIQPIRKHGSYQEIEQAVFNMRDGEVSEVIPVAGQYVILKREALLPARQVKFEQVAGELEELIRDSKLREVAHEVFRQLQEQAEVKNVFNDPAAAKAHPGVAALVNGRPISLAVLGEECIERHGEEVLEGSINRKLIEQACAKRDIEVTEADLDREIARAAAQALPAKADGSPDVEGWIELVTEKQNITEAIYRHDSVWPTVALKKLVGGEVEVTEEDIQKGYEANYGPRVRCRAIVIDDLRRAQKVWDMARKQPSAEFFGDLAEEYSIEASSRALRGEVPPIKKHGGQPVLEKEAFKLKPGELSGIVQVNDKFVILRCEGYTKPTDVPLKDVRGLIVEDIREKKLRLAMAERFEQLQRQATIDNYLVGSTTAPAKRRPVKTAPNVPTLRPVPGAG